MSKRSVGILIIVFAISLFINCFAYFSLTSTNEKEESIRTQYKAEFEKMELDNQRLNTFIDNNTSVALEKVAADEQVIREVISSIFEYTPKSKSARFKKIESLVSPKVYELFVPKLEEVTDKKENKEEDINHNHQGEVDEQETASVVKSTIFSDLNGGYLVKSIVNYDFPERESLEHSLLTFVKVEDDIITHWEQRAVEFDE